MVVALASVEAQLGGRWPAPVVAVAAAVWIAALLSRHRLRLAPLAGPLVLAAAARLDPAWSPRFAFFLSIVLAGWMLGWFDSRRGRPDLLADLGAVVAVTLLAALVLAGLLLIDAAYFTLFATSAFLLGTLAGQRQERVERRRRELQAAEEERAARAEEARAQTRSSMAAELHDVVGHSVGAMTLQAGAARLKLEAGDLEAARAALMAVESAGHAALIDLRRMLSVLRRDMVEGS